MITLLLSTLLLSPALSQRILTFADRECTFFVSAISVSSERGCANIPGGDQVWAVGGLDAQIPAGCTAGFFSDESCSTNVLFLDDTAGPSEYDPESLGRLRKNEGLADVTTMTMTYRDLLAC